MYYALSPKNEVDRFFGTEGIVLGKSIQLDFSN